MLSYNLLKVNIMVFYIKMKKTSTNPESIIPQGLNGVFFVSTTVNKMRVFFGHFFYWYFLGVDTLKNGKVYGNPKGMIAWKKKGGMSLD